MLEPQVAARRTKERNAIANDDRDSRYGHSINQSRVQKTLNRDSTIDVEARHAAFRESSDDGARRVRHKFNTRLRSKHRVTLASSEHDDRFLEWPVVEREHGVECAPTHHDGINRSDERGIAVLLPAVRRKPVEGAVPPSNESVDARPDEHAAGNRIGHGVRRDDRSEGEGGLPLACRLFAFAKVSREPRMEETAFTASPQGGGRALSVRDAPDVAS